MGNLDFSHNAGFSWYCILLLVSGLALLGLAWLPGVLRGGRILNLLFGVGFIGYGFYLTFLFKGGHYIVFGKAFIVPALLIIGSFRSFAVRRRAKPAPAPTSYGMPNSQVVPPPFDQPPTP